MEIFPQKKNDDHLRLKRCTCCPLPLRNSLRNVAQREINKKNHRFYRWEVFGWWTFHVRETGGFFSHDIQHVIRFLFPSYEWMISFGGIFQRFRLVDFRRIRIIPRARQRGTQHGRGSRWGSWGRFFRYRSSFGGPAENGWYTMVYHGMSWKKTQNWHVNYRILGKTKWWTIKLGNTTPCSDKVIYVSRFQRNLVYLTWLPGIIGCDLCRTIPWCWTIMHSLTNNVTSRNKDLVKLQRFLSCLK